MLLRHMDDFVITGEPQDVAWILQRCKEDLQLEGTAHLRSEGDAAVILGTHIVKTKRGFLLSCTDSLLLGIFEQYNLGRARAVDTTGQQPTPVEADCAVALDKAEHRRYRTVVGKLLYAAHLRPDIQFGVSVLARSVGAPTTVNVQVAKHLIRYLAGSRNV